jgi:hypothetical protein
MGRWIAYEHGPPSGRRTGLMGRWIAYEHGPPSGHRTGAYAVITADSKDEAIDLMAMALRFRREDRPNAERARQIDVAGIEELPAGDPRDRPPPDELHGLVYVGFD